MSEVPTQPVSPLATLQQQFEQDPTLRLIKQNLPEAFIQATPEMRSAYYKSLLDSQPLKAGLKKVLTSLKGLTEFAEPLLSAALDAEFGVGLDANKDTIVIVRRQRPQLRPDILTLIKLMLPQPTQAPVRMTLLEAALQNFEAAEAVFGELANATMICKGLGGEHSKKILPHRFVALCRTLDLGKQYQTHINQILAPENPPGQTTPRELFMANDRMDLEVWAHAALITKAIGAGACSSVLALAREEASPQYRGKTAYVSQLTMLDCPLQRVFLIQPEYVFSYSDLPCILYIPHCPVSPLKEYPTFAAMETDLRARLLSPGYQAFFFRFVGERKRAEFFAHLNQRLYPGMPLNGEFFSLGPRTHGPDPKANLSLAVALIEGDTEDPTYAKQGFYSRYPVHERLYDQQMFLIRDNARFLAVPTGDEDEKSRQELLALWLNLGMDIANFASLFVPALGAVLLLYAGKEILGEIYHGLEDLSQGDLQQGLDHLEGAAESLAAMALMAKVGSIGEPPAPTPIPRNTFIASVLPIKLKDDTQRLWKPDLTPFQARIRLPVAVNPTTEGLFRIEDRHYLQIDHKLYQVEHRVDADRWVIKHPDPGHPFTPALEHNSTGAFRHEGEKPEQWSCHQLFKRLGQPVAELPDSAIDPILAIADVDEALLLRVHQGNAQIPGQLSDTLKRFGIYQQLDSFIAQMGDANTKVALLQQFQLEILPQISGWPENKVLRVKHPNGSFKEYGADLDSSHPRTSIDHTQTTRGRLFNALLDTLSNEEKTRMFTDGLAPTAENLGKLIQQHCKNSRKEIFNEYYRRTETTTEPHAQQIIRDFPGLPVAVAEELVATALPAHRKYLLETGRVPQRLAEAALRHLRQTRLNRAIEGLYLPSLAGIDSETLSLGLLGQLPDWPNTLRLEIHRDSIGGPVLARAGGKQALAVRTLVKLGKGYQLVGTDGALNPDVYSNVHAAVVEAIRDSSASLNGSPNWSDSSGIRRALAKLATQDRALASHALRQQGEPLMFNWPSRMRDGRLGYALSGRGVLGGVISEASLLARIRGLEFPGETTSEKVLASMRGAGLSDADINDRLDILLQGQQAFHSSFEAWAQAAPQQMSAERIAARARIRQALTDHWRVHNRPLVNKIVNPLRLESIALSDVPLNLPERFYASIEHLELTDLLRSSEPAASGPQMDHSRSNARLLHELLRALPHLKILKISNSTAPLSSGQEPRARFHELPKLISARAPYLKELHLIHQEMQLDDWDMAYFSDLSRLQRLDLSHNSLKRVSQHFRFREIHLEQLVLNRCGLEQWPAWLNEQVPDHIQELSLTNNQLTMLPKSLLDNPTNDRRHTVLLLEGNPLLRTTLIQARLSESRPNRSFSFRMDLPDELRARLEVLSRDDNTLHNALEAWAVPQAASGSRLSIVPSHVAKRRTFDTIMNHWRNSHILAPGQSSGPLALNGFPLADFPTSLPGSFYNGVTELVLDQVRGDVEQWNQFLGPFQRLEELQISGRSTRLSLPPTALRRMKDLALLSLADLNMHIDQQVVDIFKSLPALERLDLTGNSLGQISDTSGWSLEVLCLDNTGLQQWPQWLDDMVPGWISSLSLNNNLLTSLPAHILDNPASEHDFTEISLLGNPLSRDTMLRAHSSDLGANYSFTFYMDLPQDIRTTVRSSSGSSSVSEQDSGSGYSSTAHVHGAQLFSETEPPSPEPWLSDSIQGIAARRDALEKIEDTTDAVDLLGLINHLRSTRDFQKNRDGLTNHVWQVVEASAKDPELLKLLNAMAKDPLARIRSHNTCPDGVRLDFNQMEVQVFIHKSLRDIEPAQRGQTLYQLAQRDMVDGIARINSAGRDEAEVRLAYRLRLADRLNLPQPPDSMLYIQSAAVTSVEIEETQQRIQRGENAAPFLESAVQRDFWVTYLREIYAADFKNLKDDFEAQVSALSDTAEENDQPLDDGFEKRVKVLERQLKDNEVKLMQVLTEREGLKYS